MVRRLGGEMKLTKEMKQSRFRMPDELLVFLKQQAAANLRSVNAEAVVRLVRTMEMDMKEVQKNEGRLV
ncbi:TPA: Arc family DNA-binding protein [Aeromonas hydrophila]|nr:Arc family DNA-binding protein [Aeromonas hydrophila]HAU4975658.1 Arc family DNA-binding protein [Aeromonas hydrophila]HAU4984615.1 Arc family DNA-binding protein [Aeromonas hydrophila]